MTDFALSRPITIGESFSQEKVEAVFKTNFGYQFKGITLRTTEEGRYVILLSNEGAIYNDELGVGPDFVYEGEGMPKKGDQKETAANSSLVQAVDDLIPIYLFTSTEGVDEYEYQGLVDVHEYQYVSDGTRNVYRFQMEQLGIASWEDYQQTEATVELPIDDKDELLDDEAEYETSRSRARSAAFSRKIKQQYENTCAVCGSNRVTPEGNPEVEAAHIYPKSEGGADKIQNGIALCRLHHWAFDCGWFSVSADRTVIVRDWGEREPPTEIEDAAGTTLMDPESSSSQPSDTALAAHRELHGFAESST